MKTISRKLAIPGQKIRIPSKRITGRKLQAIRLQMWIADPHCNKCGQLTAHPYGYEVDHIVELRHGGHDVKENRQLLCLPCHKEKTESNQ